MVILYVVMFLVAGVFHILVNEPTAWGYGSRKIYRSLYCACSVLMIVSMEMTYKNWRQRIVPFAPLCCEKTENKSSVETSVTLGTTTLATATSSTKSEGN